MAIRKGGLCIPLIEKFYVCVGERVYGMKFCMHLRSKRPYGNDMGKVVVGGSTRFHAEMETLLYDYLKVPISEVKLKVTARNKCRYSAVIQRRQFLHALLLLKEHNVITEPTKRFGRLMY